MSEYEKVSLQTISGGVASEMFDEQVEKVLENILDVNTNSNTTREIHLVVKLQPAKDDRSQVFYHLECYSKLAKNRPVQNVMFAGLEGSDFVGYEQDIKQNSLPFSDEPGQINKVSILQREG